MGKEVICLRGIFLTFSSAEANCMRGLSESHEGII